MSKRAVWVILFYLLIIFFWEIVSLLHIWPEYLFPTVTGVFSRLIDGFADRTFIWGIAISLRRIMLGYFFSMVAGISLGLVLGGTTLADSVVGPLLLGLRSLPSICWLPLGLLWFGLNERTILFVVIMGAAFSIALATRDGVKNIPPIYLKAASTMGTGGLRKYWSVILPATLPSVVTGLKLGWAFAWRSLMAGEMLFVSLGLGHLLMMGRELNDINEVVAVMVIIVVIGILVDRLILGALEKGVRERWGF